jgi:hypothetical protein
VVRPLSDCSSPSPASTRALDLLPTWCRTPPRQPGARRSRPSRAGGAPLRIPFWAWSEKCEIIATEIASTPNLDAYPGMFFSWPLVADNMKLAVATISNRGLQVRTPCPPIDLIPAFHLAKRRIYLTATLSDDGVLVTDLGADPSSVRRPITPERATDLGDRLILAPGALNPQVIDDTIRRLAWEFSTGDRNGDGYIDARPINVVVLVASNRAAEAWEPYTKSILHVSDMKPVIDRMSAGEHLGLVVLVNKYDGVDPPRDACRLLVIDGVPTPLDQGEQREAGALAGSETLRIRKVQRLEQGMGRGIRDAEDHCAVILLGSALALSLADAADLKHFSPATRTQIKLSQSIAEQIKGEGLGPVRDALTMFLERDETWKRLSSRATAGVACDPDVHVSVVAEARRKAWDLAAAGDPGVAARTLRDALNDVDKVERGWRLEEVAAYQHEVNTQAAQGTLKAAKQANKNTMMPTIALAAKPVLCRRPPPPSTSSNATPTARRSSSECSRCSTISLSGQARSGSRRPRPPCASSAGTSASRPRARRRRRPGAQTDARASRQPRTPSSSSRPALSARTPTSSRPRPTNLPAPSPGTRRSTTQTYAFRYSSPRAPGFTHWPARLQEPGSSPRRASSSSRTTSARSPARLPSIEAGSVRRL